MCGARSEVCNCSGVRVTTWFPAMPGLPFSVWCLLAVPCSPVFGSLEPGWKRKGFPFPATEPWQLNEHQGHIPRILCMICFPVAHRKLDASSVPMCRFLQLTLFLFGHLRSVLKCPVRYARCYDTDASKCSVSATPRSCLSLF